LETRSESERDQCQYRQDVAHTTVHVLNTTEVVKPLKFEIHDITIVVDKRSRCTTSSQLMRSGVMCLPARLRRWSQAVTSFAATATFIRSLDHLQKRTFRWVPI
jgi:hypothetical protein